MGILKRYFRKKDVLMIVEDENEIVVKKIKKIEGGIIHTVDKNSYPHSTCSSFRFGKIKAYVLGRLEPKMEDMMEHAVNYFENKYFRSMAKDTFTSSERLMFFMLIISIGMSGFVIYKLELISQLFNF